MEAITTPTVRDIAANSLAAVRVFEKYGIDYCCGGKRPLNEVCQQKGLDAAAVQRELDDAANATTPEQRDWNTAPLGELIAHIVGTHHAYLVRELPLLGQRVEKVARVYSERYPGSVDGLAETFNALRDELTGHLQKEEMILFPVIAAYEQALDGGQPLPRVPFGTVANPIRMMEFEHENAGEALQRLREITNDYTAPEYACVTYNAMIAGLKELEADLHMHIHLENNILFPRAAALEA